MMDESTDDIVQTSIEIQEWLKEFKFSEMEEDDEEKFIR